MAKSYDFKKAVELVKIRLADKQRQIDFGKVEYAHLLIFERLYEWRASIPVYEDGKFIELPDNFERFKCGTPVLVIDYKKGETDFIDCYIENE